MTSIHEDVISAYNIADCRTRTVVEGNALASWLCDRVSGDHIVFGGVRTVADHNTPAIAVEVISSHGHSLSTNEINSVVCTGEHHISGEYFSPPAVYIKAIAVIANDIAGYGVVVAGIVVYSVGV